MWFQSLLILSFILLVNGSEDKVENKEVWTPPKQLDIIKSLDTIHRSIIQNTHKKALKETNDDPVSTLNRLLALPTVNYHVSKQVARYSVTIFHRNPNPYCKVELSSRYIKENEIQAIRNIKPNLFNLDPNVTRMWNLLPNVDPEATIYNLVSDLQLFHNENTNGDITYSINSLVKEIAILFTPTKKNQNLKLFYFSTETEEKQSVNKLFLEVQYKDKQGNSIKSIDLTTFASINYLIMRMDKNPGHYIFPTQINNFIIQLVDTSSVCQPLTFPNTFFSSVKEELELVDIQIKKLDLSEFTGKKLILEEIKFSSDKKELIKWPKQIDSVVIKYINDDLNLIDFSIFQNINLYDVQANLDFSTFTGKEISIKNVTNVDNTPIKWPIKLDYLSVTVADGNFSWVFFNLSTLYYVEMFFFRIEDHVFLNHSEFSFPKKIKCLFIQSWVFKEYFDSILKQDIEFIRVNKTFETTNEFVIHLCNAILPPKIESKTCKFCSSTKQIDNPKIQRCKKIFKEFTFKDLDDENEIRMEFQKIKEELNKTIF